MTSPTSGSPALFDLKGSSLATLSMVVRSADLAALGRDLAERLGDTPDAFANDPLVLDLSALPAAAPTDPVADPVATPDLFAHDPAAQAAGTDIDLAELVRLLRRHGLQPVAVRGGSAAQTAAALALGLAEAGEPPRAPARAVAAESVREVIREVEVIREIPAPPPRTVVIDRPLRSGQQVYAKGADLVVLSAVNHGAEVIADGDIHIYAALRGRAIAGARGNAEARIYAQCLEAELVAIAGIYRTTEEPLPDTVLGKAASVRLDGEKLIMEPIGA